MCWTSESPCSKVMEIPSCPAQATPAGFTLAFLAHLSFGFPFSSFTFMDWDRMKKFFANKLGKGERCHVLKYGVLDTRFQYQGQILCVCVFNWWKIALQCCVGFRRKTSQISRYYTHPPSFSSFPPSPQAPLGHHRARLGSLCYAAASHQLSIHTW